MPVQSVMTSVEDLEFVAQAQFDAPPERIWSVWADRESLEQWWGPPGWPATFDRFEFEPGGQARYAMTGPSGEHARGWWYIETLAAPARLVFKDGFAGEDGEPSGEHGETLITVTLESAPGEAISQGTLMTLRVKFESREQLEALSEMGMEEGFKGSIGQIDALLER